jgi:hypothetical protein
MKSIVEVEINLPQQEVAELFAAPGNMPKWMHEISHYEPISGEEGMPGSTYRLVPKERDMIFVATVVERNLPDKLKLDLKASDVDVAVTSTLIALSPTRTKLISEQVFTFKGADDATVNPAVKNAIEAMHRRHIEDFKRFAETYENDALSIRRFNP